MRKRRNHGTWFPNLGTRPGDADDLAARFIQLDIADLAVNTTGVIPLTFDYPQEGEDLDAQTDVLSEIAGSEYFINRIVGKLHACYTFNNVAVGTPPDAVLFGAGIFVARAANADVSGSADVPIGTSATREKDYGPLSFNAIREPWMWRRTWILGTTPQVFNNTNPAVFTTRDGATDPRWASFPATTAGYFGLYDGPHVDVKSHRVVRLDERLWLAVAARPLPLSTGAPSFMTNPKVLIHFDYRILGKLRKAQNTGAF